MTFTHSGSAIVSLFDELPNKLLLCGFSYSVEGREGGAVPVFEGGKIRVSEPVLIKNWQVTYYLI